MAKTYPHVLVITAAPPGEAPLWVREKWVGLSLPLYQSKSSPVSSLASGVISGPRNCFSSLVALLTGRFHRESGFVVESKVAIELLAQASPEAANWWRENTPHLLKTGRYFIFQDGCGYAQSAPPTV